MEFGNTPDSKIEAAGIASVRVWALNKTQDVNGNYLTVSYTEDNANGDYRPSRIDYTGNAGLTPNRSVQFLYEGRTDNSPMYVGGSVIKSVQRLTNVKTYVGSTLVKDYRLAYQYGGSTSRSRLTSVTECAADGACLPANTFGWQEGGQSFASVAQWMQHGGSFEAGHAQYADLNGDGKADLNFQGSDNTFWVTLATGTGFGSPALWLQHGGTFVAGQAQYADVNGDGTADLIFQGGDNTFWVSLSTGSGFTSPTLWMQHGGAFVAGQARYADLNGDGQADLIFQAGDNSFWVSLSTGSSFTSPTSWAQHGGTFEAGHAQYADLNGDGKADLIFQGSDNTFWVNFSTGTGFGSPALWMQHGGTFVAGQAQYADVNGDGKTDVIFQSVDNYFYVSLSTGSGFATSIWVQHGGGYLAGQAQYADLNGDGKADLIFEGVDNIFWVSLSTGTSFTSPTSWAQHGGIFVAGQARYADLNGDGQADLIFQAVNNIFWVSLIAGVFPDLVASISNGFGGTNTFSYKPITDDTVYATDTGTSYQAVYPNMEYQRPLYVVSNMTVSDGLGASYPSSYIYGGGKYHHLGRGWLGFRWMESNDLSANVKAKEFLNQTFPFTGTTSETEVYDNTNPANPVLFAETWNSYINPAPNPYPGVYFIAPNRIDAFQYDGQSTPRRTARTMEYDSYGNPTRSLNLGDVNVTGDERDERTEWIVDATNWLHRPKRSALYDNAGTLIREKWLYYDEQAYGVLGTKGLVTKEEANAGGGIGNANNPITTHVYDGTFGIKTAVTDPRGCTTTTVYEATKTFPQSITNCLNHQSTMVYDARFGVMTIQTDANGQTTTSQYDNFGRLTKSTGPLDGGSTYGTVTQQYLDWGNPSLQRIKTLRTEQHGTANHIWSEQYFDGLGRVDQVKREGPGGQVITNDRTHDSRGLPTAQSAPFFNGETPKYAASQYDVLGRQSRFTHPDNRYATATYTPGLVTLTDERGKIKRKYFDAHGQLKQVDEVNGSETYVTTYAYDAAGSLTTVINHLGHTTRMAYDMLGRKIAMCDPNMGTASGVTSCTTNSVGAWVYTYNKAGDLLTQKDAKNQTITFTYDSLGRPLTKKQGTTSLATWTYDDPTVLYSKGRVTQVVDQATTSMFAYDQLGRTTQAQRLQLGVWHTIAQQYDGLNRITSETFPDNETISYTYNEAGWLSTVPGYINGITYNARGQKTALTYANNLTTTWTYDANNFRMTNRTTSSNQQNLTYGYDNNGNVTSITDSLFTASRTFAYDDLNRLTSATGTFGANQAQKNCNYAYNAIGNLTNKCGTAFSYGDAMHPSAVTLNPLTGRSYTYDANGNMLTRGNQNLTWDIDNRVTSVTIGGSSTIMEYDYTGTRVKKNAPGGITLYPFSGYEIDPSGVITKYVRIGGESFASKKGTVKYFYHNDHLRSVNVITNISGTRVQLNEYDPWGAASRTEGSIDPTHGFAGEEIDPETGLYYYGGRYYDHEISRFISPDPFVQEPDDPQNLNRYSYVMNNPQRYIDPSGYDWEESIFSNPFVQIIENMFSAFNFLSDMDSPCCGGSSGPSSWDLYGSQSAGSGLPPVYLASPLPPITVGNWSPEERGLSYIDQLTAAAKANIDAFVRDTADRAAKFLDFTNADFGRVGNVLSNIVSPSAAHAASEEGERPTRAPFGSSAATPPTFTGTPSGQLVMIPGGFTTFDSRTKAGIVYQHPQAKGEAYQLRIMPPGADPRYPKGYLTYTNKSGQPLDINGQAGNPAGRAATHHELDGRPIPGLEKWYRDVAREFRGK